MDCTKVCPARNSNSISYSIPLVASSTVNRNILSKNGTSANNYFTVNGILHTGLVPSINRFSMCGSIIDFQIPVSVITSHCCINRRSHDSHSPTGKQYRC